MSTLEDKDWHTHHVTSDVDRNRSTLPTTHHHTILTFFRLGSSLSCVTPPRPPTLCSTLLNLSILMETPPTTPPGDDDDDEEEADEEGEGDAESDSMAASSAVRLRLVPFTAPLTDGIIEDDDDDDMDMPGSLIEGGGMGGFSISSDKSLVI